MGGIEVVADQLARAMCARGHEVTHLVADAVRDDDEREHPTDYRVIRIRAWNGLERWAGAPYPVFAPLTLRRAMLEALAGADVVHAHGMLFLSSAAALARARRGRCVRVLTEHVGRIGYSNPVLRALEYGATQTIGRFTARSAQAIVTLNPRVAATMERLAPGTTVVQIDNGVDTRRFRPAAAGERERLRATLGWDGRPRVLFVGRLVPKKGLPIALEAARLGRGAWELVVAGSGTVTNDVPHATFLGTLSVDRIAELYRACDAFLLPSHGEGFPLTAQEAMASGLPVILAEDPAYEPILRGSGRAVRLVRRDAASVAAAVREVLADAVAAGAEAAHFARTRFSWSTTAERHLELYARLRH